MSILLEARKRLWIFPFVLLLLLCAACTTTNSYSGKASLLTQSVDVAESNVVTVQFTCTVGTSFVVNAVNIGDFQIAHKITVVQGCPSTGTGSATFQVMGGELYLDIQANAPWTVSMNVTD